MENWRNTGSCDHTTDWWRGKCHCCTVRTTISSHGCHILTITTELAKPFTPPTSATPFRFRYTSYLHESHPAANKVVVEFDPNDLSLSETANSKIIKLAGPRYNPSTNVIKMSCEKFDTQAQNKRFLGETIAALIKEAKDMKDNFEDVPFDFRHHKPKKRFEFPKEWVLTEQRKQYLQSKRAEQAKLDDEKLNNGKMIDGTTVIDTSLPFLTEAAQAQAEPVMVGGPKGKQLR
jgi:small subunit ribosomal protein S35